MTMSDLKEHYRKLEPFVDAKKKYLLNIIVHFFTEEQSMILGADKLLVKPDAKVAFTDYLFKFDRDDIEIASGRFMDLKKIKIESGLLSKNEMTFLRAIIRVLINKKGEPNQVIKKENYYHIPNGKGFHITKTKPKSSLILN